MRHAPTAACQQPHTACRPYRGLQRPLCPCCACPGGTAAGFKVPQEVPPHSWSKRGVAPPANRYNIRPGRHWDGVNRSTGFEAAMFKHQNAQRAQELEARLWSMGDM